MNRGPIVLSTLHTWNKKTIHAPLCNKLLSPIVCLYNETLISVLYARSFHNSWNINSSNSIPTPNFNAHTGTKKPHSWIFYELVNISIWLLIKKNTQTSDSLGTTVLAKIPSNAGNMGHRWKYFTWHLTSVKANAKPELVSFRLALLALGFKQMGYPHSKGHRKTLPGNSCCSCCCYHYYY